MSACQAIYLSWAEARQTAVRVRLFSWLPHCVLLRCCAITVNTLLQIWFVLTVCLWYGFFCVSGVVFFVCLWCGFCITVTSLFYASSCHGREICVLPRLKSWANGRSLLCQMGQWIEARLSEAQTHCIVGRWDSQRLEKASPEKCLFKLFVRSHRLDKTAQHNRFYDVRYLMSKVSLACAEIHGNYN